jgi:glycosyltransferase involved in cell wall biosynthesis
MKAAFWLSLAVVLYTYAGYPVIIWALSRICPRRWNRAPIEPSVSIIMAVYNGETLLAKKIDHLLHLDYPNVREIIVISDGSKDDTAQILRSFETPRLKAIVLQEHSGKAVALNAGITAASGEIILFVDARQEIAPRAVGRLVCSFADASVGCVAGELILQQHGQDTTAGSAAGSYWQYERWIRGCEATWDSTVGVSGCFYAIRRELATAFPAGTILDDMFQPLAIIRKGFRVVIDDQAHVHDIWPKTVHGEFPRKVRTLAGNFQLFRIAPWIFMQGRIVLQFISHKVLRLIVPYMLALLLLSSVALSRVSVTCTIIAAVQITLWMMAAVGTRYEVPWLQHGTRPAAALLMLNAAAVMGLHRFLFTKGPLWKIWEPQQVAETHAPKPKAAEA